MKHNYRVTWSEEDGEYVATCDSYPSLSWLSTGACSALAGLIGTIIQEEI